MTSAPPRIGHSTVPLASRLALITLATAGLLVAIFTFMVVRFRAELREEIHRKIIERDAAVLYPVALEQVAEAEAANPMSTTASGRLANVFKSARQQGMLAVAVFDNDGRTLQAVPASMLFVELPADDYLRLLGNTSISRYHPAFRLDRYFAGISEKREAPVLEVLLSLHGRDETLSAGFVRYYIDAGPLANELAKIDKRIDRQTVATLSIGTGLIAIVIGSAYLALRQAQKTVAERNERLARANFELTLSAKASALGQIISHLIHRLQGPVAGLRAVVAGRSEGDWRTAADYTDHLQALIHETVAMLGDFRTHTTYELDGDELVATVHRRCQARATRLGIAVTVASHRDIRLDSHRGSLLCLIASNLVENALSATPRGGVVNVALTRENDTLALTVADNGPGIPEAMRAHLFAPGHSGRPEGSGLGLAISQLLARQMEASLALVSTGPGGTTFRLLLAANEKR